MARNDPQVNLRMPEELKTRLDMAASESSRSLTAEIVARLAASFEQRSSSDELQLFVDSEIRALQMQQEMLSMRAEMIRFRADNLKARHADIAEEADALLKEAKTDEDFARVKVRSNAMQAMEHEMHALRSELQKVIDERYMVVRKLEAMHTVISSARKELEQRMEDGLSARAALSGLTGVKPAWREDGTLSLSGDVSEISAFLTARGITKFLEGKDAVLVGLSDVEQVRTLLNLPPTHGVSEPKPTKEDASETRLVRGRASARRQSDQVLVGDMSAYPEIARKSPVIEPTPPGQDVGSLHRPAKPPMPQRRVLKYPKK